MGPRYMGQLVNPRGLGNRRKSPGTAVQPAGPRTQSRVARDSWWTHGASDTGPSHAGQLVDPTGPQNQARVTRDSWSTPRAFG